MYQSSAIETAYKLQRVLTEATCFLFRDICISKCRLKHDYSRHSNRPVFMLYSTVKVYDVPHDGTEVETGAIGKFHLG